MAKRRSGRTRSSGRLEKRPPERVSTDAALPGPTQSPAQAFRKSKDHIGSRHDSTHAPPLSMDDEPIAESGAALVDKLLTGRLPLRLKPGTILMVCLLVWIVGSGWMAVQDNGAGRLASPDDLRWFGTKVAALGGICLIAFLIGVIHHGILWLRDRWARWRLG